MGGTLANGIHALIKDIRENALTALFVRTWGDEDHCELGRALSPGTELVCILTLGLPAPDL